MTSFVAAPAEHSTSVGEFVVAYNPTSAHRGIDLLAHGSPTTAPDEICRELDDVFRRFTDVRHVTATVLADKIDLLQALCGYGFEVVAYLPAWFAEGVRRYDCVQLAKRGYVERPRVQDFGDLLDRVVVGLSSLVPGSTRSDLSPAGRSMSLTPTELDMTAWRPLFFRLSSENDRAALVEQLHLRAGRVRVYDTIAAQLRDLMKARYPSRKLSSDELASLVEAHLASKSPDDYGVWVYYPWSGALVHILDEAEFIELRTNRNRNKITAGEQQILATKRIGVVGLSVGQSVALTLALERQFGELRLADFDTIDLSNLNRLRAGVHSLGIPKVYVAAREIAEIDPFLNVTVFTDGITADNIDLFLHHRGTLDVIVEECDSLDIKVLVRHVAKRDGIPVVMETSDRGMLDIERFDLEPERPIFHGLADELRPELLRGLTTEQKLPHVLRITGAQELSDRLLASMIEIEQTISTWPQLGFDVVHGGASAAHAARRILLGQSTRSGRFLLDLDNLGPDHAPPTPKPFPEERIVEATAGGSDRVSDPLIRNLVSQAILAPSGGNTQPWIWRATDSTIHLLLDRKSYGRPHRRRVRRVVYSPGMCHRKPDPGGPRGQPRD